MQYVTRERARGLGDWEQRLNTALVPTTVRPANERAADGDAKDQPGRKDAIEV
jgi:hypothetical protein